MPDDGKRLARRLILTKKEFREIPVEVIQTKIGQQFKVGDDILPGVINPRLHHCDKVCFYEIGTDDGQKGNIYSGDSGLQTINDKGNTLYYFYKSTFPEQFLIWFNMLGAKNVGDILIEEWEWPYVVNKYGVYNNGKLAFSLLVSIYTNHIHPKNWPLFVEAIIGKYPSEVLKRDYNEIIKEKFGEVPKHPFRRLPDGSVTDDCVILPFKRPYGPAWNKRSCRINFASSVKPAGWERFLELIIGMEYWDIDNWKKIRKITQRRPPFSRNASTAQRVAKFKKECFDGKDCEVADSFSNGNLIYRVKANEEELFIMESPNYATALYIFDNLDAAKNWASRNVQMKEARKSALKVLVHQGNWQKKLQDFIDNYKKSN